VEQRPDEVLVGRDGEVRLLDGLLRGLVGGRGRAAWLEGEPGIGKSALVGQLLAAVPRTECQVFAAAADQWAQPFPLRLMLDCLRVSRRSTDPARVEIAGLMRGEGVAAADPVLAAGERLIELVDRACAVSPVLLVVEDLHWADEASLSVWHQLCQAVEQLPLLLVGSCRPVPRREVVVRLRRAVDDGDTVVLRLEPLGAEQAAELGRRLAGGAPGPALRRELAQAGGNPLYVRELVDALVRAGRIDVTGDTAELSSEPGAAPPSLTAAIGRRLGFLTERTRSVLRLAALLENDFPMRELAVVTARPAADLAPVIEEAIASGVLVEHGTRMRFRHELIRRGLYDEIGGPVRAALHAQVARMMADAGQPMDKVAAHLLAAADRLDDWGLGWLAGVPEPALYAAPRVALELLRRAVAQAGHHDTRWEALAGRLATVLHWLGENAEVEQVANQLRARTADPEVAARMAFYAASSADRTGRDEQAHRILLAALDDPRTPAGWRGRLRAYYALALQGGAPGDEIAAQARRALAEGEQAGDRLAVGYARQALYVLSLHQARDNVKALGHLDQGLAVLGDDPESNQLRLLMLSSRMACLSRLDRNEECDATVQEALVLAERAGTERILSIRLVAAQVCYKRGGWDDVLVHLDAMTAPPDAITLLRWHSLYALVLGHREEQAAAVEHIAAATAGLPSPTRKLRDSGDLLIAARAVAAEAAGDVPAAIAILADLLDLNPELAYERYRWLPQLVRLARVTGDTHAARAAVEAIEADAASGGLAATVAAGRCCRAQLDDDAATLLDVAGYYRRAGRRPDLAATLEEAAVRLAAAGDLPAARAALVEAVGEYQALGASWDIRRAEARLRPYGIRRGSRAARRRAKTGWEALTAAEERIARLVAEGKSNPDIAAELYLSRRTVYTHVSHILAKLDLRSRYDVAREAARQAVTG
jgi:DNA-binding CsgD family transcriptional regulator